MHEDEVLRQILNVPAGEELGDALGEFQRLVDAGVGRGVTGEGDPGAGCMAELRRQLAAFLSKRSAPELEVLVRRFPELRRHAGVP